MLHAEREGKTALSQRTIVRVDLNDQVYDSLKERLLTREFGGGEKLSLQTLADELGVSRSPVHHALTRLVSTGPAGVEDTGGSLAVMKGTFRPRSGGPVHVHRQHEETFYVLEGEFLFQLGTQTVMATAGTFVFVPRDVPHAFENVGNQPGRILGIMTPGGYEQFFEELARLPTGPPDQAKFQEIFEKYDQEVVELPKGEERK